MAKLAMNEDFSMSNANRDMVCSWDQPRRRSVFGRSLDSQHILDHRDHNVHHLNSMFFTLGYGDSLRKRTRSDDNSRLVGSENFGLPSQLPAILGRRRKGPLSGLKLKRSKKSKISSERCLQFEFSCKVCTAWFREYTKADEDFIGPEGMEKFCKDIRVEPENIVMLVLAWKLEAERKGFFKLSEWIKGMASLWCDSIHKLRDNLDNLRSLLNNPVSFKAIFRFAFDFAKKENQRSLDKDTAKQMLTLLLGGLWPLQTSFNHFLEQSTRYQVMNKDQWCNVLDFSRSIRNDFSNYKEHDAWAVIMDTFVEWYKENHAAGQSSARS